MFSTDVILKRAKVMDVKYPIREKPWFEHRVNDHMHPAIKSMHDKIFYNAVTVLHLDYLTPTYMQIIFDCFACFTSKYQKGKHAV